MQRALTIVTNETEFGIQQVPEKSLRPDIKLGFTEGQMWKTRCSTISYSLTWVFVVSSLKRFKKPVQTSALKHDKVLSSNSAQFLIFPNILIL